MQFPWEAEERESSAISDDERAQMQAEMDAFNFNP
jgi:hypothetical protein